MPVQINVQANQTALAQSIAQGISQYNSRFAGKNSINLKINEKAFRQPLGRITGDLNDFESAMKASNARVLAFGASTAVLGGVVKAFKDIADATIQVEKNLADINRILNLSTGSLQKFSSQLFEITKSTATSFDQASKAALEFSRQGLGNEEVLRRTADALTLVRLTGIDSAKAVSDLTAAVNGFAKEGLSTTDVLNRVVAVEQKFAVSARDITEALSRAGQSALEAGADFNQLNALVATAQQTTARGGSVIGNALKTIFTRLQRTETLTQLENFNIQVRDLQGNVLPAAQILKNFSAAYGDLAQTQKAYLSEQVAGVYQVNILKALVNDLNNEYGVYNRALQVAAGATNEATLANEQLNKTLSALISRTGTGLTELGSKIGELSFEPVARFLIEPFNDAIKFINEILDGETIGSNFVKGILSGIGNLLKGPGLVALFGVISQVAKNTLLDVTKALPAVLGITTQAQKRATIEKSILNILQGQGDVSKALQGLGNNRNQQADLLLKLARNTTSEYNKQVALAKQLASALSTQNVSVGARGLQTGRRIKAGGYIPSQVAQAEIGGAMAGGYMPGSVIKSPVGGVMNTAEDVKYVAGFNQPFINPPAGSKAGRKHRSSSIARTGVDPYASFGFIPNFALPKGYYNIDGSLNNSKITSAVKAGKITETDARAAGWSTSGEKKAAAAETARPYNLKTRASMLVPDTDFFDPNATKKFQSGFQIGNDKYDSVQFSIHGLKRNASKNLKNKNSTIAEVIDDSLYTAGKTLLKSFDPAFIKGARISKNEIEGLVDQAGGKGARESLKGAFFEGIIRKLISTKRGAEPIDPTSGTLDTRITSEIKDLFKGQITSKDGDFKANKEGRLRSAFASQVLKNLGAKILSADDSKSQTKRKGKFAGFIPNFAYKNAVMSLEENMSGKKAVFSNSPIPHVRNSGQGSFASAVADHGGLQQAVKDSYAAQSYAGLANSGYIPNFAPIPRISSKDVFGKEFSALTKLQQSEMKRLNQALRELSTNTKLSASEQLILQKDIKTYASQLQATTGSTQIVQQSNKATTEALKNLTVARQAATVAVQANTTATAANTGMTVVNAGAGSAGLGSAFTPRTAPTQAPYVGKQGFFGKAKGVIASPFQKISNFRAAAFERQAAAGGGGGLGMLGATIAAPILGGIGSQLITRGRDRSELSTGERLSSGILSNVPTAAASGAFIGSAVLGPGFGTAVGAVVGGLTGLAQAALSASDTLEDLDAKLGKLEVQATEERDAVAKILQLTQQLQGGNLSENDRRKAVTERGRLVQTLSSERQKQIGSDFEVGKLEDALGGSDLNVYRTQLENSITRAFSDLSKASPEAIENATKDVARLASVDTNLKNVLKELGKASDPEEFNKILKDLTISGDFGKISENLQKLIKEQGVTTVAQSKVFVNQTGGTDGAMSVRVPEIVDIKGVNRIFFDNIKEQEGVLKKEAQDIAGGSGDSATQIFRQIRQSLLDINLEVEKELAQANKTAALREIAFKANQALSAGIIDPIEAFEQEIQFQRTELDAAFRAKTKEVNNNFLNQFIEATQGKINSPEITKSIQNLVAEKASIDDIKQFVEGLKGQNIFLSNEEEEAVVRITAQAVNSETLRKQNNENEKDIIDKREQTERLRITILDREQRVLNEMADLMASRQIAMQNLQTQNAINASNRNLQLQSPGTFNRMNLQEEDQFRSRLAAEAARDARAEFNQDQLNQALGTVGDSRNQFSAIRTSGLLDDPERSVALSNELAENEKAVADFQKVQNKENLDALIERKRALIESLEANKANANLIGEQKAELRSLEATENNITNFLKQQTKELENQNTLANRQREARTTAKGGYERAIKQIRTEAETFPSRFAENTTLAFRDGLVNAMDAAINRTDDLESALLGVASSFLQSIQSALMGQVANQIVGALPMPTFGGNQRGGLIRAQNGMYISGGRTGDRNLALLEDGEYVLNREAVKGMGGPKALDGINYGAFPRFASGGRLKSGERKLSENVALGSMISAEGSDASARVNLSATSDQLSAFAQENTVFIKEYYQQRRQLDAIRRQKRAEKKAKRRQMITQIITTAAMMGMSSALGSINFGGAKPTSTTTGGSFGGGEITQSFGGLNIGNTNIGGQSITSPLGQADIFSMGALGQTGGYFKNASFLRANSGGYIPYGNRITDSIPAMLTGGEYVVNSNAVRKYGVGGLNSINSGIARFQDGGMVSSGGAGGGMTETNTNTSSTNNVSVNITVNAQGGNSSEETNTNEEGSAPQTQAEKYADFSKKVKQVVMQVINTEQRSGGLLDSTKKKQQ